MAVFETWLESDLQQPVKVKQLTGNLFSADNGGNKIGVKVYDGGQTATLSGTVTGYIIREDNATVTVTGTLSGNTAYIVLPASAYLVVGRTSIVIKIGTTTLAACTAYVYRTTTDTLVDPGHVIPSIAELLAKIGDCETATTNANNKANLADQKATAANNAANAANTAAGKIDNMTIAVTSGGATQDPTATLTLENGHYKITFSNLKGMTGDAFKIVKTYASIAAMEADFSGTDTHEGDLVMIVSNVEDPDNAKVYIKGASAWSFVVDMSGATGIQGQQAFVWIKYASAQPTQDSDMKDSADSWMGIYSGTASTAPTTYTSYTWYNIKGTQGFPGTPGRDGDDGNDGADAYVHIRWSATEPTQDSDMKTTPDEWMGIYSGNASTAPTTYTSYTWYKVKGETGSASNVYANTIALSSSDSTKISEALATKATKVTGATSGNLAGLDSNGNLTDSGKAPADFVAANQGSGNAGKALGIGNDGSVTPVPFSGEDFTGATSSTAGTHGYVPAPSAGDQTKFLQAGGGWAAVPMPPTMVGASASANGVTGLVPAPAAGSNAFFLRGDATWADPPGGKLIVVDLDTVTNTSGSYTHSTTISGITADMKAVKIELGDPSVFLDTINIVTSDGAITLTCASVEGTSTVKVSLLFIATANAITSSEFDVLAGRIGTLSNLTTTEKSSVVGAVNEINEQIATSAVSTDNTNHISWYTKNDIVYVSFNGVSLTAGAMTTDLPTAKLFTVIPLIYGTEIVGYVDTSNGWKVTKLSGVSASSGYGSGMYIKA